MKALEARAVFNGHFDHDRQLRIHQSRLRSVRTAVDNKEPESIHTRCSSPSKMLMTKNAERDRVTQENLMLARKIFNIMEGDGEITQMVNDTQHIDSHPGTMNFRVRLHEAQKIHARNMLLAARLDSVKPYYRTTDIKVVKPIKKLRARRKPHSQKTSRFARELEYAIYSEQQQEQQQQRQARDLTPRSDSKATTYTRDFRFKEFESTNGSQSARKADPTPVATTTTAGKQRPTNVLLEYTKIQDGRVLDVAVLKEPFRDRYAIFGIDVDDGQRYELRLTSDDVSNILDGDILVTSVDNIEVWMALLNKVALSKVSQFTKLPAVANEGSSNDRGAARSFDSIPKPADSQQRNNGSSEEFAKRNAHSETQFGRKYEMSELQPTTTGATANAAITTGAAVGRVPVAPVGARPSMERPMSRSAGSARGRGSRGGSSRPAGYEEPNAMIMDAPIELKHDQDTIIQEGAQEIVMDDITSAVAADVASLAAAADSSGNNSSGGSRDDDVGSAVSAVRDPQVPKAIPEESEEAETEAVRPVDDTPKNVPSYPMKFSPMKPKAPASNKAGHSYGARGGKKFTVGYRSSRSTRKQSAASQRAAVESNEEDDDTTAATDTVDVKPTPPSIAINRQGVAVNVNKGGNTGSMKASRKASATAKPKVAVSNSAALGNIRKASTQRTLKDPKPAAVGQSKQSNSTPTAAAKKPNATPATITNNSPTPAASAEVRERMVEVCKKISGEVVSEAVAAVVEKVKHSTLKSTPIEQKSASKDAVVAVEDDIESTSIIDNVIASREQEIAEDSVAAAVVEADEVAEERIEEFMTDDTADAVAATKKKENKSADVVTATAITEEAQPRTTSMDDMRQLGASADSAASTVNVNIIGVDGNKTKKSSAVAAAVSTEESTFTATADELQDYSSDVFDTESEAPATT